jgi:hypothetical protein
VEIAPALRFPRASQRMVILDPDLRDVDLQCIMLTMLAFWLGDARHTQTAPQPLASSADAAWQRPEDVTSAPVNHAPPDDLDVPLQQSNHQLHAHGLHSGLCLTVEAATLFRVWFRLPTCLP